MRAAGVRYSCKHSWNNNQAGPPHQRNVWRRVKPAEPVMCGENDNMIAFRAYWKSMETEFLLDLHEIISKRNIFCFVFAAGLQYVDDNY